MLDRKILNLANRIAKRYRKKVFADYPKANFPTKCVEGCISLATREDLLLKLKPNAVVAEIGVFKADFSQKIMQATKPQKMFLIDVWGSDRYNDSHFEKVTKIFANEIESGQVEIIRKLSFDGIQDLEDSSLDWVYLDTDHMLETTRKELALLESKIKPGGIIAGHDYIQGNWNGGYRYGVVEAVREFCIAKNWKLVYLTHELEINPSFAIQKI